MKKNIVNIVCVLIIAIAACTGIACQNDKEVNPFSALSVDDIDSVTVHYQPQDESYEIQNIDKLVNVLREVVVYGKDESANEMNGASVTYTLKKKDGTEIVVTSLNPYILIDGVGYKAPKESCEKIDECFDFLGDIQDELLMEAKETEDEEKAELEKVSQAGPFGKITLTKINGFTFEPCEIDSGKLNNGSYGIKFYPIDADKGCVELVYFEPFGVCGTGLEEEIVRLSGDDATIGTYDEHKCWDFIAFSGKNENLVASTYEVDGWWDEYKDQVSIILDSIVYEPDNKEGGAFLFNDESYIEEYAVQFSLKNIRSTGATAVFEKYDDIKTDELLYGPEYKLEYDNNGSWEEVTRVIEDVVFNDLGFIIPKEGASTQEVDWEVIYGALKPGNYRMTKSVNQKEVKAYFVLN